MIRYKLAHGERGTHYVNPNNEAETLCGFRVPPDGEQHRFTGYCIHCVAIEHGWNVPLYLSSKDSRV